MFLHVPYYSIEIWNRLKGHEHPEIFNEDDRKLNTYVNSLNSLIDSLNQEPGTYSPSINQDKWEVENQRTVHLDIHSSLVCFLMEFTQTRL